MSSVRTWLRGAAAATCVLAAVAAAPGAANATLSGTVAIGTGGFLPGPTDTLLSPIVVTPDSATFGVGTGDFAGFSGTAISGYSFDITSLATLLNFSFTSTAGNFGSVTADAYTAPRTDRVLSAELIGTFTDASGSAPAALLVTFGQVGGPGTSISNGATLTTTIPALPEPISLAMLGTGLLGLGVARRLRKA